MDRLLSRISIGLLISMLCGTSAISAENRTMLRGRVSNAPARAGGPFTVASPFGLSVRNSNGQLLGQINTQNGMAPGTMLVPSAIGPLILGPRGEIRGTMASRVNGGVTPPIGMGPTPNFSAVEGISEMRRLFAQGGAYPMNAPNVVMPLGTMEAVTRMVPMTQTQSYARVIPRSVSRKR